MFNSLGIDNSWSFKAFKKRFKVEMQSLDANDMAVDLIGIDPAIANALRRILIAEIPTMAIEHVYVVNNTSIVVVGARVLAMLRVMRIPCSSCFAISLMLHVCVACRMRCLRTGWALCPSRWMQSCSRKSQASSACPSVDFPLS